MAGGECAFLFTDVENSTNIWEKQPERMKTALERHDALLRQIVAANAGAIFKTVGDGFYTVFADASNALKAAFEAQLALKAEDWGEIGAIRVRMGLHVGPAEARDGDYFGPTLNRAARVLNLGHGEQILLSDALSRKASPPPGCSLRFLEEVRLKGVEAPERVHQLLHPSLRADFPNLRHDGGECRRRLQESLRPPAKASDAIERRWLNALLNEKEQSVESGYILITASPGVGKTTFMRRRAAARQAAEKPVVAWFVEASDLPENISHCLIVLINDAYDLGLSEKERKGTAEAFRDALQKLAGKMRAENDKAILYIDSIHESEGFAETLPKNPGENVVIVLSARPGIEDELPFVPLARIDLLESEASGGEAKSNYENNAADIRDYLRRRNEALNLGLDEAFIVRATDAVEGCFQMATHLLLEDRRDKLERYRNGSENLPQGFEDYLRLLWNEIEEKAASRRIPLSAVKIAMGILAVSGYAPLAKKEIGALLQAAQDNPDYRDIVFDYASARDAVPVRIADVHRYLDSALTTVTGFFRQKSGRFQVFHNFFGEFILRELAETDANRCRRFVADYRLSRLNKRIADAEDAMSLGYLLEDDKFVKDLENWLRSLQGTVGNARYVAPIAWYLYGHYWWDMSEPNFPFCTALLELLDKFQPQTGEEIPKRFARMREALHSLRKEWNRNPTWNLRKTPMSEREEEEERWRRARAVCDDLEEILERAGVSFETDSARLSAPGQPFDANLVAPALLRTLQADCLSGTGEIAEAARAYEEALAIMEQAEALKWCRPYVTADSALAHLDNSDRDSARKALSEVRRMIKKEIRKATGGNSEAEVESVGYYLRSVGDFLWDAGDYGRAFDCWRAGQYCARLQHYAMNEKPDAYTVAIQRDNDAAATDALLRYAELDSDGAAEQCRLNLEFWSPYWGAKGVSPVAETERWRTLLAERSRDALREILYPSPPEVGEVSPAEALSAIRAGMDRRLDAILKALEKEHGL